jgi:hypothetical protein
MGRKSTRIAVEGDIIGEGARETARDLRSKFLKHEPLEFVSKVSLQAGINRVLIEELSLTSVKARPNHFQYSMVLVEYVER